MKEEIKELRDKLSYTYYKLDNASSWRNAFCTGFDKCYEITIKLQEILESRASQFESTLKETIKARDELNEKLKIATEALEEIGERYNSTCSDCDGGEYKYDLAREALEKIKEMQT